VRRETIAQDYANCARTDDFSDVLSQQRMVCALYRRNEPEPGRLLKHKRAHAHAHLPAGAVDGDFYHAFSEIRELSGLEILRHSASLRAGPAGSDLS
jgi:hypothetical protein